MDQPVSYAYIDGENSGAFNAPVRTQFIDIDFRPPGSFDYGKLHEHIGVACFLTPVDRVQPVDLQPAENPGKVWLLSRGKLWSFIFSDCRFDANSQVYTLPVVGRRALLVQSSCSGLGISFLRLGLGALHTTFQSGNLPNAKASGEDPARKRRIRLS
jgi:hypothetical protein